MEYKKRKTIWMWFIGLNVAIVIMTFLLAWLLSLWAWWSLVGAFWVFVAFSFTCSVQKNVLDWLVKNDPVKIPADSVVDETEAGWCSSCACQRCYEAQKKQGC